MSPGLLSNVDEATFFFFAAFFFAAFLAGFFAFFAAAFLAAIALAIMVSPMPTQFNRPCVN